MKNFILVLLAILVYSCSESEHITPQANTEFSGTYLSTIDGITTETSIEISTWGLVRITNFPEDVIAFETESYCGILEGDTSFSFNVNLPVSDFNKEFSEVIIYFDNGHSPRDYTLQLVKH